MSLVSSVYHKKHQLGGTLTLVSSTSYLMVAFGGTEEDEDLSVPFDAAVVTGSKTIQLLVRDSAKPGRGKRGARNRWTVVSTAAFAAAAVADAPLSVDGAYNPQTAAYLERVTPAMVEATRDLLRSASSRASSGVDDEDTPTDMYRDPPTHASIDRRELATDRHPSSFALGPDRKRSATEPEVEDDLALAIFEGLVVQREIGVVVAGDVLEDVE